MPPSRPHPDDAREQCFVLAATPREGEARLHEADERHARRVLRLRPGAELVGLDGHGSAWPLRVSAIADLGLRLEARGEPRGEPRPGSPGSVLPELWLAVAWPRGRRADELLAAAVGLGASRITPALFDRSPPHARGHRHQQRDERLILDACKVSQRLWFPTLDAPMPIAEVLRASVPGPILWLERSAPSALAELVDAAAGQGASSFRMVIGPEGGFSPRERELARELGARPAALGPQVLRVEQAAAAGVALLTHAFWSRRVRCPG